MTSTMNDCSYYTGQEQWMIVVIKHGEYNEWLSIIVLAIFYNYNYSLYSQCWNIVESDVKTPKINNKYRFSDF
jgi:hypothetical protein